MSTSLGIIGGADGPTAIFITGDPTATVLAVAGITLLVILAVRFFRKRK